MATEKEKATLRNKLATYEGCVEHMYLDTKGYATIGIGHLLANLTDAQALPFVNKKDSKAATKDSIKLEYEAIKKKPKGLLAISYKKDTKLKLKQADIDKLTNKHIANFENELKKIFGADEFEAYPGEVRLALFDMIFNLGMTNLKGKFPTFIKYIKENNWSMAATESSRSDVSKTRNTYVKDLLEQAASTISTDAAKNKSAKAAPGK